MLMVVAAARTTNQQRQRKERSRNVIPDGDSWGADENKCPARGGSRVLDDRALGPWPMGKMDAEAEAADAPRRVTK